MVFEFQQIRQFVLIQLPDSLVHIMTKDEFQKFPLTIVVPPENQVPVAGDPFLSGNRRQGKGDEGLAGPRGQGQKEYAPTPLGIGQPHPLGFDDRQPVPSIDKHVIRNSLPRPLPPRSDAHW